MIKDKIHLHKFKNQYLDQIWRVHPSYKKSTLFQRLEFYGDKILSFVITSYLYQNKNLNEGDLSVFLSSLINKDTMAHVGSCLKQYIICTGALTNAMICDCVEVYIACVYLDGGDIFQVIQSMWSNKLFENFQPSSKNQLQEILQQHQLFPIYTYTYIDGLFECKVSIDDARYNHYIGIGRGKSKKIASANAAHNFITSKYKL